MRGQMFVITGVNPEPWAMGTASAGRRGGTVKASVAPNQKLQVYQNAMREEISWMMVNKALQTFEGDMRIRLWFWRQVETGHAGPARRAMTGNYADSTNLQKATEDAMQGLLYMNDRHTRAISSEIVEQGPEVEPSIVIHIESYEPFIDEHTREALRAREFDRQIKNDTPETSPWS